jgi:phage tail-like protein
MALNPTGVRLNPLMSYNFLVTLVDSSSQLVDSSRQLTNALVSIQNVVLGGFSECSGLEMSRGVKAEVVGGQNYTPRTYTEQFTWSNIRLRRGVTLSDDLWNWYYGFFEHKGKPRDGIIFLQNDLHIPVKIWVFRRGIPVKWTGPAMNAAQGQVAIEELEIAHEKLELAAPSAGIARGTGVSF